MSSFPSYEQALQFLYTCGCSEKIIKHVQAVSKYGVEVAESCSDANVELVRIGGLLHDIGRCRTHQINHGIAGAQILRRNNIDERIARIAERHVGAGITADEAAGLGLPSGTYVPQTIEEKIVAAVDNLIEGSKRVSIDKALAAFQREVEDRVIVGRIRALHEEVFSRCFHSSTYYSSKRRE
ncbi:MAG: HDIG domain-containing protein [Euryarchaeota archaeon]|nr:HDIG domain-containing protein [Euryarchaeota archaeon]